MWSAVPSDHTQNAGTVGDFALHDVGNEARNARETGCVSTTASATLSRTHYPVAAAAL